MRKSVPSTGKKYKMSDEPFGNYLRLDEQEKRATKRENPKARRGRKSPNVTVNYGDGFPKGAPHSDRKKGMGDLKKLDQDLMDEKNLYRKGEKKHKKEMDRINKKKGK